MKTREILVTGAGSGLGLSIAEYLAQRGDRVVGTVRSPARAEELTRSAQARDLPLHYLPLELTDGEQVDRLADEVGRRGLDVLVHNAGFGVLGPVEEIDEEAAVRQFEANLLGPMRLNRRLLPILRERQGRVLWISSMAARFPLPYQAHYSATKAAMTAFACALRMELAPFGVKVTVIEPGDFNTSFPDKRQPVIRADSPYREYAMKALEAAQAQERGGAAPEWVARVVDRVSRADSPPVRLPVGRWARTLCALEGVIPDPIVEWSLRRMFRL